MPDSSNFNTFAHLTTEKSRLYRAILGEFARAKSRFVIHLRPDDVRHALRESNSPDSESMSESALQQLVEWGNLESHPDTSEVATVNDFWLVRNLYQMSPAGEATEEALAVFEQSIRKPGELQAAALDEIQRRLARLAAIAAGEAANDDDAADLLGLIRLRFEELTAQAQRFIGGIQRRIDLQSLNLESFLNYKQRLIEYLEQFLRDLVLATHEISNRIRSIEPTAVRELLHRAADRELVDRLIVTEEGRAANRRAWEERWEGLGAWFIGAGGRRSQADELRAAARAAIPALIATVSGINERRAGHSDRAADFSALALWFAQTESDADAHRLWRAAFALHPCRHLSVTHETIDQREAQPVASTTSWLDAPPLRISPRLHKSGRYTPRGRPATVIDRAADKALLARLSVEESEQIHLARRTLCAGSAARLSQLAVLNDAEFHLLLDLLGDALAAKRDSEAGVSTVSSDGAIRIDLIPTADGAMATIRTSRGVLVGRDHYIHIRESALDGTPSHPVESLA